MQAAVQLCNLGKSFGKNRILDGIDLNIREGEFLVLVGPSGCGKSTCLRLIAGLETPSEGDIFILGRRVNDIDPKDRDIGMVFQSYALYPHLTVFENMAFGLRIRRRPAEEIWERVRKAAAILRIEELLDRKPRQLSGGQRQRVALGRAIVRSPKVFLFDEPLSNLDARLRNEMRVEIKKLHQLLGNTMVYVTHDQVEATTMGDRIAIMNRGRIEQLDTPCEIYRKPANRFVAGFVGSPEMNFLEGEIVQRHGRRLFRWADAELDLTGCPDAEPLAPGLRLTLGIRPEDLRLRVADAPVSESAPSVGGVVEVTENLGERALTHCVIAGSRVRALIPAEAAPRPSTPVSVQFALDKSHWFDPEGVRRSYP